MNEQKVKIEVQHFEGCPNYAEMITRVRTVIEEFNERIEYKEILVETPKLADQIKFRGSPTVLINGIDIENMPEPTEANLACRYYKKRLPTIGQIKEFITTQLKRAGNK